MAVLQNMLTALNVLCYHLASDARVQISRLGENIFISLIYLWNKRPTDVLKVSKTEPVLKEQLLSIVGSEIHLSGCFRLFTPKFGEVLGTYECYFVNL